MVQYTHLHTEPKIVQLSVPISGPGVDRAPSTETVDSALISDRVKPKTTKIVFTAPLLDV